MTRHFSGRSFLQKFCFERHQTKVSKGTYREPGACKDDLHLVGGGGEAGGEGVGEREQVTYRLTVAVVGNSLTDKLGRPLLVRVIRAGRNAGDDERHFEMNRRCVCERLKDVVVVSRGTSR